MRKGKTIGIVLSVTASLFLAACGTAVPDMTEEQNAQIVEYAAGLLLKYDENQHSRLVDLTEITEETPQEAEAPIPEKKEEVIPEVKEEPEAVNSSENTTTVEKSRSIEEFYGLEDVEIQYTGYELKDSYISGDSDEISLAMTATKGCKLLVLNFNINNISGQDVNVDMQSSGAKFKISINGEPPRYALTTMLLNDLGSYSGTITAGGSVSLVLIGEIAEEKAVGIQSISLSMKNAAEDASMSLN